MPDPSPAPTHLYRAFGLTLGADFEIPDLVAAPGDACADVLIRNGKLEPPVDERPGMQMVGADAFLYVPDVARYQLRNGSEIIIEPEPNSIDRNIRLYLLGSALGMILHQRGLLPLHANSLVIDGGAVAFLGHPGAGKSTMAAWLTNRGHPLLSDDVCLVTGIERGAPEATVGLPRMRLWRDALEATGLDPSRYERSFDDMDKYDIPARAAPGQSSAALRALYVLEKAPDLASSQVTRVHGAEAVDAIVANTYRGSYVEMLNALPRFMLQCVSLARQIPVFRARRAWGHDIFDEQARALEAHALDVVAAAKLSRQSRADGE